MFGCHNCGKKIKKNTPYAHSPCATCRAEQNPMPQSQYQDDPAGFPTLQVMHPAYMEGVRVQSNSRSRRDFSVRLPGQSES